MQVTLDTTLVLCHKRHRRILAKKRHKNTKCLNELRRVNSRAEELGALTSQRLFLCFCAFLWLELDDAAADADGDGLCTVGGAELFHDVFDVNFHRLF